MRYGCKSYKYSARYARGRVAPLPVNNRQLSQRCNIAARLSAMPSVLRHRICRCADRCCKRHGAWKTRRCAVLLPSRSAFRASCCSLCSRLRARCSLFAVCCWLAPCVLACCMLSAAGVSVELACHVLQYREKTTAQMRYAAVPAGLRCRPKCSSLSF